MLDAISQARLQSVHPVLADKVRQMSAILEQEKIAIRVVQGLRSWQEQDNLYAIGRTIPGHIVTNCPGGKSYHNFGLAVDCVPDAIWNDGIYTPDWNSSHASWKRMEQVGEMLGLESGAEWRTFPDAPHFQLTGRFPIGSPPEEIRTIFKAKGMQGVWDAVTLPVLDPGGEIAT